MLKNLTIYPILACALLANIACDPNILVPTNKSKAQFKYIYELTEDGCSTGLQKSYSLAGYCANLLDDDRNNHCAHAERQTIFYSNCKSDSTPSPSADGAQKAIQLNVPKNEEMNIHDPAFSMEPQDLSFSQRANVDSNLAYSDSNLADADLQLADTDSKLQTPAVNTDKKINQIGSLKLSYQFIFNGCDTGKKTFGNLKDYCSSLQNDEANNFCAKDMRIKEFEKNCSNI